MRKLIFGAFLTILAGCGVATDPVVYEDVVGLAEEIVKDEAK